jgi:hypothetical protein
MMNEYRRAVMIAFPWAIIAIMALYFLVEK